MTITPQDIERHLEAHGYSVASEIGIHGMRLWVSGNTTIEVPQHPEYRDWSLALSECLHDLELAGIRYTVPDRCSLCRAVATVHLPPELGASALCRPCADRVRAALEPPAETEQKQLDALYNLGLRGSRVPRCTCPDCCR